jgi:hypothetical protein
MNHKASLSITPLSARSIQRIKNASAFITTKFPIEACHTDAGVIVPEAMIRKGNRIQVQWVFRVIHKYIVGIVTASTLTPASVSCPSCGCNTK